MLSQSHTHCSYFYGLPGAIVLSALLGGDLLLPSWSQGIGLSARGLSVAELLMTLGAIAVPSIVGFLAARESGRVQAGMAASAWTVGLPWALWIVVLSLPISDGMNGSQSELFSVVVLLISSIGPLTGAAIGWPGSLLGRARYRHTHAESLEPAHRSTRTGRSLA